MVDEDEREHEDILTRLVYLYYGFWSKIEVEEGRGVVGGM